MSSADSDAECISGVIDEDSELEYCRLKASSCTSYRDSRSPQDAWSTFATQLHARSYNEIRLNAAMGNLADCLEAGIRKWAGAGATKDMEEAEHWWLMILDAAKNPRMSVSRKIRAHAASCLAFSQWERRTVDGGTTVNIDSVYRAGSFGNEAASLGFTPPTVLHIAQRTRDILAMSSMPGMGRDFQLRRFGELEFLFEALAKREKEVASAAEKREAKISQAPNAYHCAAPDCGIEATQKSALFRCAGKCPIDVKPSYCSKECQRAVRDHVASLLSRRFIGSQHWKVHRLVCKPDAKPKEDETQDLNAPIEISTTGSTHAESEVLSSHPTTGKEHIIELPAPGFPGGKVMISSKTMSPAFMREVRDRVAEKVEEYQAKTRGRAV